MKTIAILQSNYIPWKGYFDIINSVDEFVIYDEVQYTRRDWRNRNLIKTRNGIKWLTIPVQVKGRYSQKINETRVKDGSWAEKHWKTIAHSYSDAACFNDYKDKIEGAYHEAGRMDFLSEINYHFLRTINDILGIRTPMSYSENYKGDGDKTERIISICTMAGADSYLSGPAAKAYIDQKKLESRGISLVWADYSGYPVYRQMNMPFEHKVSVLDLILNEGVNSDKYLKRL